MKYEYILVCILKRCVPSHQVWSHKEYPLIPVGKLVLNRNPVNYFAEVEQLAFDPSNMPPGIEPSPDKMLQVSRAFAVTSAALWALTHA